MTVKFNHSKYNIPAIHSQAVNNYVRIFVGDIIVGDSVRVYSHQSPILDFLYLSTISMIHTKGNQLESEK